MRLWSLHPKYLDAKGLVAVWREGLLARKVIEGKTKGYTKHPQLMRFRQHPYPDVAIDYYLKRVFFEAAKRGYRFDENKINTNPISIEKILTSRGQVDYEWKHLLNKLKYRDRFLYHRLKKITKVEAHPLFKIIAGKVEDWEIIS